MRSINLIFGCHSHQPVGNFDFVFEEAYRKAYMPFVEVLERFPGVHLTLHYTGPLYDWFLKHQPDYLARLRALVASGQVEIMGGGYYEPLLCAIPERDAVAQITGMQRFCEAHLGGQPRGMWLTERVWEPQMARTLARAGIEYTALDDTHFLCSGVPREKLFGYHMTEDEGYTLKVFPILEKLRYLIPFAPVAESIEYLRELATEDGTRCAVFHDDGEKFGVWPYTFETVYEKGWLTEFFTALEANADWLKTKTYSEFLDSAKAVGRTYITCASYFEMMEWALPTVMQRQLHAAQHEAKADAEKYERYGQFLRGGFWRGFLAKYPESNNIQKRMLRVSRRVERLKGLGGDEKLLAEAERLLHEGQCNCAYWHGAFGGIYLNHLRTALYEKLIAADVVLDQIEHPNATEWSTVEASDFDGDGNDEVILDGPQLTAFFSPADGGTLFELDYKKRPFNFLNTLARRDEPYHDALRAGAVTKAGEAHGGSIHDLVQVKEEGLDRFLVYDPYRRASLRDRLMPFDVTAEMIARCDASLDSWDSAATYTSAITHSLPVEATLASQKVNVVRAARRVFEKGSDARRAAIQMFADRQFLNKHSGLSFTVSGQSIRKMTTGDKPFAYQRIVAVQFLDQLIENAIEIIRRPDDGRDPQVKLIHELFVPFELNRTIYRIRLLGKELVTGRRKMHSLRVEDIVVEALEKEAGGDAFALPPPNAPDEAAAELNQQLTDTMIVSDLLSCGKSYAVKRNTPQVTFTRTASVFDTELCVTKSVQFTTGASGLMVEYVILNAGGVPFEGLFGVEFCVNLLTGDAHDRYLYAEGGAYGPLRLGSIGEAAALPGLALRDDWMGLEFGLTFGEDARVFHFPIDTVSQSEAGQERVHQGCVVLPSWPVRLAPGETWAQTILVEIRHTRA